ncbi:oxidized low-density lipoprotein receptor 1-like [Tachyglossus aculeatus]|uniref:oxidized low-density lipoprotein receptor 1-like n=1 Tax=Tachyglossus aculeatus TaxID=9261 RepID=UPI0018F771C0|nr:oxidized low-density lipoprotein receptor 1-like [Tachyglossus aculeatus]
MLASADSESPVNNKPASPTHSASSCIVSVILGVFSLTLLASGGYFGYQFFQMLQNSDAEIQNLKQKLESLQNRTECLYDDSVISESMPDACPESLLKDFQNRVKMLSEALQELKEDKGLTCPFCPENWLKHGENCYNISVKKVPWSNCSAQCALLGSTFLQSGNRELLDSLVPLATYSSWIGLSYKDSSMKWTWIDGSPASSDLKWRETRPGPQHTCAYVTSTGLVAQHCIIPLTCVCEKNACDTYS